MFCACRGLAELDLVSMALQSFMTVMEGKLEALAAPKPPPQPSSASAAAGAAAAAASTTTTEAEAAASQQQAKQPLKLTPHYALKYCYTALRMGRDLYRKMYGRDPELGSTITAQLEGDGTSLHSAWAVPRILIHSSFSYTCLCLRAYRHILRL